MKKSRVMGVVCVVWLFAASSVFAGASGDPIMDRYTEAKQQLQNGIHDLIVKTRPDLADIAQTYRDMQLALIVLRSAKFEYLMENDSDRIVRNKGVLVFTNFEWTEQDAEQFNQVQLHRILQAQVKQLKERNNNDPRWPDMREHFVTLTQSPEYREVMQAFMQKQNQVAADLKSSP